MGLLDFMGTSMDDPKTAATLALAQGLLTGRSGMTGLLGGLQGYGATMQAAQDRQRQIEREKLQQQMLQAQAQQLQQAAAERKAAAERAAGVEAAYRGAFRSPEQQAMAQNGGPTVAAAGAVGNFRPTIDQNALIAGLAKADPQAAAQMLAPEKPNYMTVDGALVQTNAQGGPKAVFERQKPTDWNQLIVTGPDGQPMVNRMLLDAKGQIARAGASNTSVSYGTPVQAIDAQNRPVFIQPTKDGSPPNIIPGVRPPMSAAEERAAAEKRDRDRQGQQMMSVMQDARAILSSGKATASGVGNVVDAVARTVGKTTVGAQDAARLEALSGWLVANVPRMEGPQSNFDVANYTTMAGKVGDRTVPIAERLAALAEVEKLQRKYSAINSGAPAQPAGPSLDDLLKKYGN